MPHIHELIDFTVRALIVHPTEDKLLLVYHPRYGLWLHVGGHVELNENSDEALIREIKEEAGLEAQVLSEKPNIKSDNEISLWRPDFVDIHDAHAPHKHIALTYICLAKSDKFELSSEHDEIKWLTLEELRDSKYGISNHDIFYAEQAIKKANEVRQVNGG